MNREQWLTALAARLNTALFTPRDHPLPVNLRISVGFPSRGGASPTRRALGQCWQSTASDDGQFEVFISPTIGDGSRAGDVLVHELCHALLPEGTGHKRPFAKLAKKMGLEGKATATIAGDELRALLEGLIAELGPYPHAELRPMVKTKRQAARMHKVKCAKCGYTARVAKAWIEKGTPLCPCSVEPMEADAIPEEPGESEAA